jgi:ATP-dependent DNA helicase RecG
MDRKTFIKNLLTERNSSQLELLPIYNIHQIFAAVCSFLNSDGGWVVIGYSEEKNSTGLGEDVNRLADQLEVDITNGIFPQPLVYAKALEYKGKNLILINVVRGSRQPYSFEGKYYVRNRGQAREAKADDISLLIRSSNEYPSLWEKSAAIDVQWDDLDFAEINKTIIEAINIGKGKSLPNLPEEFLSYFQLKDYSMVKNGAMVLFGRDPVRYLPQARIRVTIMPHEKTGDRYADATLIEENLFGAFDRLKKYFKNTLPMISEFSQRNWERTNRDMFPLDALDEAIVNAIVHRDYGDVSGEVTINIYSDRMEIINSGEIPEDIVTRKNRVAPHHSILRNPSISHMFYLRGKMEKLGRGLDLIISSFEREGLRKPEWVSKNGYTTLTMFSSAENIVLNERMHAFLLQLTLGSSFASREYAGFFPEISEKTVRLDIAKLVSGNWVEKSGDGPATKYYRTRKELPEITGY